MWVVTDLTLVEAGSKTKSGNRAACIFTIVKGRKKTLKTSGVCHSTCSFTTVWQNRENRYVVFPSTSYTNVTRLPQG